LFVNEIKLSNHISLIEQVAMIPSVARIFIMLA